MSILVTGATGKIGEVLVKLLKEQGSQITVFARDANKAAEKFPGVKVAAGDITNFDSFRAAAKGHERVFLLTNSPHLEAGLCGVAKEEGVKHVVRISCWLADAGGEQGTLFQLHGQAEVDTLKLGIAVTHLRPSDFFQNFLTHANSIKHQGVFYHALHPDTRLGSIDVHDIAAVAARVLRDPIETHAGLAYTLTGPQALTREEAAQTASKVLGKKVQQVQVDDAQLAKALQQHGIPGRMSYLLTNLSQQYRLQLTGPYGWTTGSVEIITGQKPRTFEQFLEASKGAFQ